MENEPTLFFRKFLNNNCTRSELNLLFLHFGSTKEEEIKKLISDHLQSDDSCEIDQNDRLKNILAAIHEKIPFDK
ncbi:hypothetical protein SAMN04488023_1475 [Pedobacter rhizosphaerae]|uniref:Uncharacterized protein n=1 Tax=Pedobacter rhizosphaerae TaxID=390241 RepID=A0A1H9VQK1_9SPHI|nr:hypothetical protein SAMN04488023_1475 [Pedobacter rhizosphaerae]